MRCVGDIFLKIFTISQKTLKLLLSYTLILYYLPHSTRGEGSGNDERTKKSLEFDPNLYRQDFPILNTIVHGKPLVYFDNAATTQKPRMVIEQIVDYYQGMNANVHRAIHYLGEKATVAFEEARKKWLNSSMRQAPGKSFLPEVPQKRLT